jgi:hypothetical protein
MRASMAQPAALRLYESTSFELAVPGKEKAGSLAGWPFG